MADKIDTHTLFKVTADDFGYCKQRNAGIKELISMGRVHNISVLINGSHLEQVQHQLLRIGIHFNLTEGSPVSSVSDVPSLIDARHKFHGKFGFREKLVNNLIEESEVELELVNQVEKFISVYGHAPHYIDGHQHVHVLPKVVPHCIAVMHKYDVTLTRIPKEIGISACDWIEKPRLQFYEQVCGDAATAAILYSRSGIDFPKYFIGLSTMSLDMSTERFERALNLILLDMKDYDDGVRNRDPLVEIMVHPGYPSVEDHGGCGDGPDDFSCSTDRLHELEIKFPELPSLKSNI